MSCPARTQERRAVTGCHDPAGIPGFVRQAIQQSRSGRPRPVALSVPADVLTARTETDWEPASPGRDDAEQGPRNLSLRSSPAATRAAPSRPTTGWPSPASRHRGCRRRRTWCWPWAAASCPHAVPRCRPPP
ncbi:hypothetical protein K4749_20750 [Streptomyces sp. TRM72054]|nr:hypothetical protein [Streptomyces sp. TRM72054]